jgi:hypothetical protein
MQPFELRTSSFCVRDESQLQSWRENDWIHYVSPLLRILWFRVQGFEDVCACKPSEVRVSTG